MGYNAKSLGLNVGSHVIAGNGRTGKVASIGPPCQGAFVEIDGAILTEKQRAAWAMGIPQGVWVPYDSLIKSCSEHKGVPIFDGMCNACKREAEAAPVCSFCPSDFCRCTQNSD